jgi:hypothetical protein
VAGVERHVAGSALGVLLDVLDVGDGLVAGGGEAKPTAVAEGDAGAGRAEDLGGGVGELVQDVGDVVAAGQGA